MFVDVVVWARLLGVLGHRFLSLLGLEKCIMACAFMWNTTAVQLDIMYTISLLC